MGKNDKGQNDKDLVPKEELLPTEFKNYFNLKENMEGVAPRLPQIGIVHQAQLFTMPDEAQVKEFEGIILDTNRINAWWEISFDESGGGTPPDCFSMNGIEPDLGCSNVQAPRCSECEKNQFGSDSGSGGEARRGKACKNMKRVHVILKGEMLPHRLTLPPSNLKAIDIYISLLTSKGVPYQLVIASFKLKKVQNKDGIGYSEVDLIKDEVISDDSWVFPEMTTAAEKAMGLKKMLSEFKGVMRGQEIILDEYGEKEE